MGWLAEISADLREALAHLRHVRNDALYKSTVSLLCNACVHTMNMSNSQQPLNPTECVVYADHVLITSVSVFTFCLIVCHTFSVLSWSRDFSGHVIPGIWFLYLQSRVTE